MLARNPLKLFKPYLRFIRSTCGNSRNDIPEFETSMDQARNGIRVVTEQTCSPLACVSLFIETGPRFEPDGFNGINHFIEHLAFKGLIDMSKREVENFVAASGSHLTAHTSQEFQSFSVVCTPEWIQHATFLLCGIINKLEMNECEVERERDNIYLEMEDADRDYKTLVFENLIQSAFQGTSLGQKVIGPSRNLACFERCTAYNYMSVQYQPWRIVFASSAPVPNGLILANVDRLLGCMPTITCDPNYGSTRFSGSSVIYRDDSKSHAHVAVAFEAPGYLSEDYMAMRVLKNIVGSWSKTHAVYGAWPDLAARCADTELCDSYESFYLPYRDIGLWGVYFVCRRLEPEDFLHNWQDILMSMSCHINKGDVARGKLLTKMELMRGRHSATNSSLTLGREIIYKGKRMSLEEHADQLDCIQWHDLQRLAYNTFYNKMPVLSAAGPTENIPDYNRLSASQYWIRW